jgi:hypothetical protein
MAFEVGLAFERGVDRFDDLAQTPTLARSASRQLKISR